MAYTDFTNWPMDDRQKYLQAGYWCPVTLGQQLANWAQRYGDKTALVDEKGTLSYHELTIQADQTAAGFYNLGIRRDDRVLVQLPNCNEFVVTCFALFRLGALPILTMPAQRENDISALTELAEPVAYIVADNFLGFDYLTLAEKMQQKHACLKQVIVVGRNSGSFIRFDTLQHEPVTLAEPEFSDPALLLLSGGTTGTPKLIPRTHADYIYNATASAELCELSEATVYLAALPVAHNFPLACPGILGTLNAGGKVVMAKTPGNDETFDLIEREKVTITALVPPLVQLWISAREWDNTDISSLRLLQVGGSRCDADLAKQVSPVLGCQLQQVFGMAEGLLCYTRLDDPDDVIINSQGRPLCPDDELRIVDQNGLSVAPGDVGELHTKGPYTLRGYYRAVEHNASTFTNDGFYQSGDLVRMTEQGNLIVEGRIKEQINRAGEKIAVAEVEHLLNQHPEIEKSVLIPVPDRHLGERSCAFIITGSSPLTLQAVHQFLADKGLPRYKLPDQLVPVTSWPLTAVGKIDKKRLLVQAEEAAATQPVTLSTKNYAENRIKVKSDPLDLAMKLARCGLSEDYVIYEKDTEWSIGIGKYASITGDKNQATMRCGEQKEIFQKPQLTAAIHQAMQVIPVHDWRAYGSAKFELSHLFYGIPMQQDSGNTPLLDVFIPRYEIRFNQGEALLRTIETAQLDKLVLLVQQLDEQPTADKTQGKPVFADIENHQSAVYQDNVQKAVEEIKANQYQKVILSRRIPLPSDVDIIESFRIGRRMNTPARAFLANYSGVQLAGFSPETVVEVSSDGWVSTQPLAGTRSLGDTPEQEQQLRQELLSDTKEIAEHAASVKLAQEELETICTPESINVSEFMGISRRGSVQHLTSRLKGKLSEGKHAWDAFEALFPAVTASGIPKKGALDAIQRLEPIQRDWYSGCVMIVDENGAMDAALVLRSIYQQGDACWLQAGAGIVDQSKPERELQETVEKLSCISQHLVSRQPSIESESTTKSTEVL
ncbi:iron aquisition 2,3-dihydroxybenzoate-AMP ligase [Methylophaga frappieri]|uniref:Iron aquisition 2,3-dihydroxybenzoate-AMP ligase n=1 Tax=Methylophaga frappieri (strain ATCC BAA-2434 / DSM 25690 / JAM7) TaxID=754477 RepID=I1YF66_METFJ|nr:salicylate synthase [Methylophaga frappieri]AFJ01559.1 iron aquisition 2,3-dihydroxybenzoate-AMP ligase [Methylophaga frappieri]